MTRVRRGRALGSEVCPVTTIDARSARVLARVRDIRQQIDAGTYLTDDKLDLVVECLCAALDKGRQRVRRATA